MPWIWFLHAQESQENMLCHQQNNKFLPCFLGVIPTTDLKRHQMTLKDNRQKSANK